MHQRAGPAVSRPALTALPAGAQPLSEAEAMAVKFPIRPGHPERICWGCDRFCPADDMRCGNGTDRAQHPVELWGEDWMSIGCEEEPPAEPAEPPAVPDANRPGT